MKRGNREEERQAITISTEGKLKTCLQFFLQAGFVVHWAVHIPGNQHKRRLQLSTAGISCPTC